MRLGRTAQRAAPEPIIALIDVVFFLLVFFMLIGRMDATAPFLVDPPLAASGADMPGGGETLAISENGTLALNGKEADPTVVLRELQRVLADDPDRLVRINAHRGAPLRDVLPLAGRIEGLGARHIVLVVTPGQD